MQQTDVIVVGKGNAALCAALEARANGARVVILEAAPEEESGGNSRFAGGMLRFAYNSVEDLRTLLEITDEEAGMTDWDSNTVDEFYDDLYQVTNYRTDPQLSERLVTQSFAAMQWLRKQGVRFVLNYRASAVVEGRRRFFGRVPVEVSGGGPGLVQFLDQAALKAGIDIQYDTRAVELIYDGEKVSGVKAKRKGRLLEFHAPSVILACGGFEANPEWRTKYLGPGWELAKVRGTRYNTGDGIRMALDIGAQSYGQWSGCHSVAWERYAADFGDVEHPHAGYRHSYPFGIMVNSEGKRFVDEGADFRNYTYAKYGRVVLQQPGSFAWQIFDQQVKPLMRDEYKLRGATKVQADTLEQLVEKMQDVHPQNFLDTVREYNAAVKTDVAFDPNVRDGRGTSGLAIDKTNWANRLEKPPFEAYSVGCGITFTFGGLKINPDAHVLDIEDNPIPGLYAAGELVGGLYYFNYPGSTGLMAGAVFGRIAGREAAQFVRADAAATTR